MSVSRIATMNEGVKLKRVTVLGGLGFIGSHLGRALVEHGYEVRMFDRPGASRERVSDFAGRVDIREGNISNAEEVIEAIDDVDVVINLVHTTVPGSSMEDPCFDISSNVEAAVAWLRQLGKTSVRRIIYVSSGGTVYGVPEFVPITEAHPTNPICSYGITKLAIEKYTALYAHLHDVDHYVMRPSNVYGPGQQLNIGQGVIGVMSNKLLHGEPVEIWGEGEEQRDYLYIDDFVDSVMAVLNYRGPHKVFNVSSGEGRSVNQILAMLQYHFQRPFDITHTQHRGFDVPINVLDSSRLMTETAWRPLVDLKTGIGLTLEWIRAQV